MWPMAPPRARTVSVSVIIDDAFSNDLRDFGPIEAAPVLFGKWIVIRKKDEPIRMNKIHSKPPVEVSRQFMAPRRRNAWNVVKCFGGNQFH